MHDFLRAIGFSNITKKRDLSKLLELVIAGAEEEHSCVYGGAVLAERKRKFAGNLGIAVRGEIDESGMFMYEYYFPFFNSDETSLDEYVTLEKMADKTDYNGICDPAGFGVSVIFHMNELEDYADALRQYGSHNKRGKTGTELSHTFDSPLPGSCSIGLNGKPLHDPCTTEPNENPTDTTNFHGARVASPDQSLVTDIKGVCLSALSLSGKVLLPVTKDEAKAKTFKGNFEKRRGMMAAAMDGDQEAFENLTMDDMDLYTSIVKRIQHEDVMAIVDNSFMPYGIACDQYMIVGDIQSVKEVYNQLSGEMLFLLGIDCMDMTIQVCINSADLVGEPKEGRRFRGSIWLQGVFA